MFENAVLNWQFFVAVIGTAVIAYLLGSINFAIIITKFRSHKDIRDYGSGNAGMTNVLRTEGKKSAAVVLVGDFLKGVAAVGVGYLLACWLIGPQSIRLGGLIGCLFVMIGHLFPVFYQFKGGKGVLASAGAIIMLDPLVFGVILLVFLIVVACSRIVSLASIFAAAMFPVSVLVLGLLFGKSDVWVEFAFAFVVGAAVIAKHHQNIVRLVHGTENKLGKKK